MNNTKKVTIVKAVKTLPQVFSLLYKSDNKYLIIMLLEVAVFSIDKYPALLVMKYTLEALESNVKYADYIRVIIPLIVMMLILKMVRVVINTSRPCRDQIITEKLFNAFFMQCMKKDYQTLESKEIQDKKELAKYIANGKIAAVGWFFVEMFSSFIALIIAAFFIIQVNYIVLVIVLLGLIAKTYLVQKQSNKTNPITKQQVIDNRYLSYLYRVGTDYEYVKEYRIFNYKDKLYNKIITQKDKYIRNNNKLLQYNFKYSVLYNVEDFIIKVASFGTMGGAYLKARITIGDFSFIIGLVNDFISYSSSFMSSCKSYVDAVAYIDYYMEFMNDKEFLSQRGCDKNINNQPHIVEFKNVYFKYPNNNAYALKNVNLKLKVPMKVALVGKNGAGKSTLIKLLLRLYKPDKGQILVDGVNIYDYSDEEYIRLFSSVFQDFQLFAFSISDNITSFDVNIDSQYFADVTRETGVEEFICNYPPKYETYFSNAYSNEGVEFSGGEQQKIALARSIYKKGAKLFVLDEPTSTYDAEAEYELYKNYEKLLVDKTSIFISHRMSSCILSDYIILLDNGEVIEEGTHKELMERETQYKCMFELQATQYNSRKGKCYE